jgi:DNA-binding NtrC family response regulator
MTQPGSDQETDLVSEINPGLLRPKTGTPRIQVQVVDGPDRALVQDVTSPRFSIGSSRQNEIVLGDPTVSRQHLRVDCSAGILVRDLESRNGTFLGDLQIREALVPLGARLRLGRTMLCFHDNRYDTPSAGQPISEVPGLIGRSHAMLTIAQSIRKIARSSASVLLQGETGTGKELVARAIHELGPRATGPFIAVDSGVLSTTLMASQLFGHERGAFTGADARREGAFELAQGGTLFLDEIGDLPPAIQPALLGVLERKTFRRLGGRENIHADVRILSATHRDLRAEAAEETFRSDLYFRLAVVNLHLPPLRDRIEDLDLLVTHFIREIAGPMAPPFSDSLMLALRSHRWSGNIRELRNVVENVLTMGSANLGPVRVAEGAAAPPDASVLPYRVARSEAVSAFEHHYIGNLIKLSNGNASKAARVAGMDRPYLLALLRKHGLRGLRSPDRD